VLFFVGFSLSVIVRIEPILVWYKKSQKFFWFFKTSRYSSLTFVDL
jgi:hypothetical protein